MSGVHTTSGVCPRRLTSGSSGDLLRSPGGQPPAGAPDLVAVEWRAAQEDQPLDAELLQPLPSPRAWIQPPLVEAGEHRDDEARRIAPARRVLVTGALHEIGELRMHGLGVEAVAVAAGNGRHA